MDRWAQLDHRHVWHPFTQMRDWLAREPIVIAEGQTEVELVHQITLTGMGTLGPLVLTKLMPRIKEMLEESGEEIALVGHSSGVGH